MNNMYLFRKAEISDAEPIVQLVNSAYRGESSRAGWTTEADMLDGSRISVQDVQRLIESEYAIILLCLSGAGLLGTICLEKEHDAIHIGMFAVNPALQGKGIGKQLLAAAENLSKQVWVVQKLQMHVITIRHELIAFYARRGYQRTGILSDFPVNPLVWQPKLDGLQLETLEKIIRL
ncbi:MAG: GNAT family N-acetyltransferase [Methylotenera sp.]|nr:GNAT family N-acetyltransferase [Methylotenera sp.]